MSKNQKIISLILLCIFLLTGCMTKYAIPKALKESPANNRLLIHKNPEIGDYAIHKIIATMAGNNDQSTTEIRYEITSIQNDLITIKIDMKSDSKISALENINYEYIVDKDGYTKQAYFIDFNTGEKTELQIVKPGEMGYFDFIMTGDSCTVESYLGNFDVQVGYYESETGADLGGGDYVKLEYFTGIYINPDVKFLLVESYTFVTIDKQITTELYSPGTILEITNKSTKDGGSHAFLVEQGNINK